jgi:hypothetical protein
VATKQELNEVNRLGVYVRNRECFVVPNLGFMVASCVLAITWSCGGTEYTVEPDVAMHADTPIADTHLSMDTASPELPNACGEDSDCDNGKGCSAGVCVSLPGSDLSSVITNPVNALPTDEAPNLSCVGQAVAAPEGPEKAILYGAVARFGSGLKTYDIRVEVFDATTFDPSECGLIASNTEQQECYEAYGTPIGEALSKKAELQEPLPETCAGHGDCPLGYRCIKADLGNECLEQYGVYEIPDVPTNTPLVLRATATKSISKWHTTYSFNVYLFADSISPEGRIHVDATMVSHGQWLLTPNTVGLGDVPPERGVLGGRIRDCRTDDRDSWAIGNVTLGLASPPKKFVFFNELEDDTVPLSDRTETNILGRFAALDVEPGWNALAGYASIAGENVEMGSLPVYVFPNSLTVVTWPGLQPFWSQK